MKLDRTYGGMTVAVSKPLTISLPADLLRDAERLANAEAIPQAKLIEIALRQYVRAQRWQQLRQWGAETAKRMGLKTEADLERFLRRGRTRPASRLR